MQTSAKKACFQFAECSFSSAKKMQTSAKKACFQFAECSFFFCKENANERKESLLSICRVQLFFCKDTTFPRNFQGFREKILEKGEKKEKIGGSRN